MLIALAGGIALLLLLGAFAAFPPGRRVRGAAAVAHGGCLVVSVGLLVLAVWSLASGGSAETFALPLGPVRGRAALAVDGLSAWFMVPIGVAGAACALSGLGAPPSPGTPALPLLLAGTALCLSAAEGSPMLVGLGLVLLAAGAAPAAGSEGDALPFVAGAGLVCFAAALGLLGGGTVDFATVRALPVEGWRAAALPLLGSAGACAVAAALPLAARRRAAGGAEGPLLAAAVPLCALYVLARLLPDLGGSAQPSWWGVPLMAGGVVGAVLAALRAAAADEAQGALFLAGAGVSGLSAAALGASLVFRGADLGAFAALAAGGALLLGVSTALAQALGGLAVSAVARGAGSARLDRLGGLAHAMPFTAAAALLAAATLAFLPLFAGFAGAWSLLQACIAGWRLGGVATPLFCAAALAGTGAAMALLAAAALRVFAVAFLGRPRTPRGAGAVEVRGAARWALLVPAAPLALLGLVPGWALAFGGSALALLVGPAPAPVRGAGLAVAEGGVAYAPLLLAALLALAAAAVLALAWRLAPGGAVRGAAWDGGFLAPPPHLPFGEPLTQPGAAGFSEPLFRLLRGSGARFRRDAPGRVRFAARAPRTVEAALGGGLAALAAALAALALAGAG